MIHFLENAISWIKRNLNCSNIIKGILKAIAQKENTANIMNDSYQICNIQGIPIVYQFIKGHRKR